MWKVALIVDLLTPLDGAVGPSPVAISHVLYKIKTTATEISSQYFANMNVMRMDFFQQFVTFGAKSFNLLDVRASGQWTVVVI